MSTVHTVSLTGFHGHVSTLTATTTVSTPAITFIGGRVRGELELRERVFAALTNSGWSIRHHAVEVDLGTAATPCAAAVAVAILAATADIPAHRLAGTAVLGEVGLDGSLRATLGTLPAVQTARAHGVRRVIVPAAVLNQASLVDGIEVLGAHWLTEVTAWLRGDDTALHSFVAATATMVDDGWPPTRALAAPVLSTVEIAAAGGHHLLLDAVDSAGTFLVGQWLHHLLPDLTTAQQLQVAAIRSLIGNLTEPVLSSTAHLVIAHHGNTLASLVGDAVPGAVSKAHHSVLVACDLDQFSSAALKVLQHALLQREVTIAHGGHSLHYPAGFQLFATRIRTLDSRQPQRATPLLDTIDIRHTLTTAAAVWGRRPDAHEPDQLARLRAQARTRVGYARARAAARWSSITGAVHNGRDVTNTLVSHEVLYALPETIAATIHLRQILGARFLSPRDHDVVVRLAWTVADLADADLPDRGHVERALALRQPAAATREVR
ncbi:ATP-binding protein [Umezawaea sp. Da 62-37]|uniref:ATP-binding protein n=1 Tax=Umezawaea sp. Da 62-37 TaxID=3075927 RepID=UPI0028F71F44|nr:ATP-binding protein [Umezawaea sp. Da 62-37]WNV83110.1 ATP-binding protein [Umezawaea sp. Da 62-37]